VPVIFTITDDLQQKLRRTLARFKKAESSPPMEEKTEWTG